MLRRASCAARRAMSSDGPLTLYVPEPAVRPGGVPDFSNITIPRAGSVDRPPVGVDALVEPVDCLAEALAGVSGMLEHGVLTNR